MLEKGSVNNYLFTKSGLSFEKGGTNVKRAMLAVMLVLALIFGYALTKSMAQGTISKGCEMSEVGKLIGTTVKDSRGEDLGTITDIMTGPKSCIAFAILSYWVFDDTQELVAIPLGALSCHEQNCVLNVGKDKLDSAPAFLSEDDMADPKIAGDIYRYFSMPPYWTEERGSGLKLK